MLYFVHMPPPPSVATFMEYFEHLWRQTVGKYINCAHIYLVFDKTDLLPPPRSIVHESRSRKVMGSVIPDPAIRDDAAIPHTQTYSSISLHPVSPMAYIFAFQFHTKLVKTNF